MSKNLGSSDLFYFYLLTHIISTNNNSWLIMILFNGSNYSFDGRSKPFHV